MVEPQPENCSASAESETQVSDAAPNRLVVHPRNPEGRPADEEIGDGGSVPADFAQSLRHVLHGIESLSRAHFEQVEVLSRVEKVMMHQTAVPKILSETKQALEQRNLINRAMFEALHAELKTYKDAFVLDAVLKPVIRDLISLYDDVSEIHRQLALALISHEQRGTLAGSTLILFENVAAPANQLEHNRDAIIEVLERLDVSLVPLGSGKLDKQAQRAVSVELADDPEQDQDVVKVVKRGFTWRDRVIRPEEVVIKKWKEQQPSASARVPAQP
jgi:molecular chaperone GrpE (heat shock protein)